MNHPRADGGAADHGRQLSTVDGLAQLSFLIQRTLERRAAEHDLSLIQTRLLAVLRDRQPTMNELARMLDLDKSSVTGLVDRAERRGLVRREPSLQDRRSFTVSLTPEGRSLVSRVAAGFEADVTAMLAFLPLADQGELSALISQVLVSYATEHGVDLFATGSAPASPSV